ncbi:uncharacterized protein EKO05_0000979 [Ascochyta rabiei]|uniref:Oxidoreductase n=1 Tax=Didymella rabiei TaxID=5454 RepID=A0A163BB22_DIDRA|nr:uncharacterized protein EKO05_0000979 [Ascochyta rabiei]KZM21666.1 oxidoreductase [Ascochyta rabiei]UPX10313.1 hypothetical protein EKO05_0000979 [Ascochyta rabiei]
MAPYVLTPTSEQDHMMDGREYHPIDGSSSGGEATPTSSASGAEAFNNGPTVTATVSTDNHLNAQEVTTDDLDLASSLPSMKYEDAYTHGYKDGYTCAHVELKHQPIAIIGMSCRLPGSVSTPDEFWELLARSRTGFSKIPSSRFSDKRFFHSNPGKSGATNARGGNFLTQDLAAFDAPFFGFTQQEAISLDPQQRLLLECTFEALESAGIPKHNVVGTDVGVFVGGTFSEYEADLFRDPDTIPMHQATGCAMAMQSNRISHFFDLRGPSYTVDTACSSSLVALHNACQSLRTGESSMALAAGVHLNMLPEFWISYSMSRLFGEEGRSFAFDQRGTGYGRGEGCGMVLLKPLDQAIKDNDPIRAVITGTGINQDGKTPGITMPNGAAQEALIRSVYSNGGMDPRDTGYVEAHGTGTRVGDPIEVGALHRVFGEGRNKRKPLFIGSVKSNIGHLEAAAGIAGVIKTALMLERGFILPNYDFKHPNENIPFDEWGLKVATRQQPWPLGKRWASVNGFGFGGTNGHVVMTRGPLERRKMKDEVDTHTCERLFVLSANDKISTEKAMQSLGIYLEQRPEIFQNDLLSNLAYTLGQRKSFHPWRIAVTASSGSDLVEALSSGRIVPCKQEPETLRLGWIFTGQGAQWWAMGRELYDLYPVYASSLKSADKHLTLIGAEFSLLEELGKDESSTQVNAAYLSQPACTAVQLALVDLLRSWGIRPAAVVGHSSGEIGAAYAAGLITFRDAMTIAYHRGRLVPILKKNFPALQGCMMAVGASTAQIMPLLDHISPSLGQARIACINSPSSVTISGDERATMELQALLENKYPGMFVRKLQVDTAYHSHHMDLVAKEYTEALREIESPMSSNIRFHSSLLGRVATGAELDATYWVQNLTCAVRFDEALQSMCEPVHDFKTGVNFLCELGPHAALQGPVKQILKHVGGAVSKIPYTSVLSRKKDAVQTALAMAGALFVKGATLDMGSINFPTPLERPPQVLVDMPRYSWNHSSRFYHESRITKIHKFHDVPRHDLIGVLAAYSNDFEPTWRNVVRLDDLPWLRQYQMQGVTIFPISGFLSMAIEAMAQKAVCADTHWDTIEIDNLVVKAPVMLTEEQIEMTITLQKNQNQPRSETSQPFVIRSWCQTKGWSENCTGSITLVHTKDNEVDGQRSQKLKRQSLYSRSVNVSQASTKGISTSHMYTELSEIGVAYGTLFQGLRHCHTSSQGSVAQIIMTNTALEMPHHQETSYVMHPAFIEQLISVYWPVLSATGPLSTVHLPSSIGKVTVSSRTLKTLQAPGDSLQAICEPIRPVFDNKPNTFSIFGMDSTGEAIITMEDLSTSPIVASKAASGLDEPHELCYKLDWETMPDLQSQNIKDDTSMSTFDAEVVIIHGDTELQYAIASALTRRLITTSGVKITQGTVDTMAHHAKNKLCLVLTELDSPLLSTLSASQFAALKTMLTSAEGVLWVVRSAYHGSKNPDANMVSGLSRTLRSEGTLAKFITLDLDAGEQLNSLETVSNITRVLQLTLGAQTETKETEFRVKDGKLLTPRIINDDELNNYIHEQVHPAATELASFCDIKRPLRASITAPGAAETLVFDDDDRLQQPLSEDYVDIQIKATGLNAAAHLKSFALGLECSGVVTAVGSSVPNLRIGDRVAAITTEGSLSTMVRVHSNAVYKAPGHISFEQLATMPIAYCTAVYALENQAQLSEGESILIHDAASPVGQAVLTVAQTIGASVWVTVKTEDEKLFIMRQFSIVQDKIWFTGDTYFADRIQTMTQGHGIDVVFNTLKEQRTLCATWACLARFGRFISVGSEQNIAFNMPADKNASIFSTDMTAIAQHRPQVLHRVLADVARMSRSGQIQPILRIRSFSASEMVAALQHISAADCTDKAVVVPQDGDRVVAPRIKKDVTLLRKDATYILIGGTGGLGRSMAKWMVERGAKHIVLLSRSGTLKGKAAEQIAALNTAGANIIVRSCDVANKADVDNLVLRGLSDLPPVRGIVHGAMVLRDVLFENMTHEQYTSVISSKVQGAWNFHHALASTATALDFFVVISSAAGAVGNRGQAAYAAANTFLNGFAQHLLAQGINAASLDLTAVSDAGYLAEDAEKAAEVARNLGSDTICLAQVLGLLQAAVEGKLKSCNGHPITGMRITPTVRPFWSTDPKFVHLLTAAEAACSSDSTTAVVPWSTRFRSAASRADAQIVVCAALVEKIADVVSMEAEELDIERSLSCYPLDSLTAIEVRNFITRMFESNLQVLELLASGSIKSLAAVIVGKTKAKLPEA